MRLSFFLITAILLSVSAFDARSQARKKKKGSEPPAPGYATVPSSLDPGSSSESVPRQIRKRKVSSRTTFDQQQEYYNRVVAVAKAREKAAKVMAKPQYSDPMYFGHKKKPKKRPAHKMRLCKECGIRH